MDQEDELLVRRRRTNALVGVIVLMALGLIAGERLWLGRFLFESDGSLRWAASLATKPSAFPKDGTVLSTPAGNEVSATLLLDEGVKGVHRVVRLEEPWSGRAIWQAAFSNGGSRSVKVPKGSFKVVVMEGNAWYGPMLGFAGGHETTRLGAEQVLVEGSQVDLRRPPTKP